MTQKKTVYNNNINNIYITLTDASKLCDYSQEYLSLRARQGKLKAIKQGRNWMTTKEWLGRYTEKFNEIEVEYVSLQETLDGCEKIIDGRMDKKPEEYFYMIGALLSE